MVAKKDLRLSMPELLSGIQRASLQGVARSMGNLLFQDTSVEAPEGVSRIITISPMQQLDETREALTAAEGRLDDAKAELVAADVALGSQLDGQQAAISTAEGKIAQAEQDLAALDGQVDAAVRQAADAAAQAQQVAGTAQQAQQDAAKAVQDAKDAKAAATSAQGSADKAGQDLLALAGKTGRLIRSGSAPAGADQNVNNLWLNTSTGQLSQWDGSKWVVITDSRLTAAQSRADQAYTLADTAKSNAALADSKAVAAQTAADQASTKAGTAQAAATAAQSSADSAASKANSAQSAAATAQGTADQAKQDAAAASSVAGGKADVLIQSSEPAVSMRKATTLWIDTTGAANTPKRWSGSAWVAVTDKAATDAAAKAVAAQQTADGAVADAKVAKDKADAAAASAALAQSKADDAAAKATTADGRYTVATANPTASDASGKPVGAVWEVRSSGQMLRKFVLTTPGAWTQVKLTSEQIDDAVNKAISDAGAAAGKAQTSADTAKARADLAVTNAAAAQSKADAADGKATTADGRYTVSGSNPTAANGSGKPVGAVWEVRSGSTSLRRFVWDGTTWTQVKAGQEFIGDNAIGRAQIGDAAVGTAQIADGTITNAKIGSLNVGDAKVTGTLRSDQIAADSITADKIVVADFTNCITDPEFLAEPWLSGYFWAKIDVRGIADRGIIGKGTGTQTGGYHASTKFAVKPGQVFRAKCTRETVAGSGGRATIYVRWYNAAGSVIGLSAVVDMDAEGESVGNPFTAPALAEYAVVGYYLQATVTAATTIRLSKPEIRLMQGGEMIIDGTVTAAALAAKTITAESGVIGDAAVGTAQIADAAITNAKVGDLDAGKVKTGFLDANRIAARTLSADKVIVGTQENLIPNGAGEFGSLGGWIPSGLQWDATDAPTGLPGSFASAAGQGGLNTLGEFWDVEPGAEYLFEVWLKADKPDSRIYINLRDPAGVGGTDTYAIPDALPSGNGAGTGNPGGYVVQNYIVPTEWTKVTGRTVVKPGVNKLRVGAVFLNHQNGSERGAVQRIAGMRLMKRSGGTLIVDGAIGARQIKADEVSAAVGVFIDAMMKNLTVTGAANISQVTADAIYSKLAVVQKLQATKGIVTNAMLVDGAVDARTVNVTEALTAKIAQILKLSAEQVIIGRDARFTSGGLVFYAPPAQGQDPNDWGNRLPLIAITPSGDVSISVAKDGQATAGITPAGEVWGTQGNFDQLTVGGQSVVALATEGARGVRASKSATKEITVTTSGYYSLWVGLGIDTSRLYRVNFSGYTYRPTGNAIRVRVFLSKTPYTSYSAIFTDASIWYDYRYNLSFPFDPVAWGLEDGEAYGFFIVADIVTGSGPGKIEQANLTVEDIGQRVEIQKYYPPTVQDPNPPAPVPVKRSASIGSQGVQGLRPDGSNAIDGRLTVGGYSRYGTDMAQYIRYATNVGALNGSTVSSLSITFTVTQGTAGLRVSAVGSGISNWKDINSGTFGVGTHTITTTGATAQNIVGAWGVVFSPWTAGSDYCYLGNSITINATYTK